MTDQTEIERLEERIMNGGSVSAAEMSDAMRNADAEKRINQLMTERTVRSAQSDLQQLGILKAEADGNLTPFERLAVGNAIDTLEVKIKNDTNK